jgi:hypothetical protein
MLGGRGRRLCWPLIPVPRRVVESFSLVLRWFLVLAAGFLTICSPNWRTRAGGCWLAHPPRSRRRPHGDRLGRSACNARGIHLACKHNNRVRARPAIQHWVSPQMGSSSTFGKRGAMRQPTIRACDRPHSRPLGHAEILPWCGWHQAPTRLPECGTPGLEEYPREGNKQQASAGRQKSMRCPHSSCTVALCRNAGAGGSITIKPGTASKTPRFNWRHLLRSSCPLSTQDLLATRAEACRSVSPLQRIACSNHRDGLLMQRH